MSAEGKLTSIIFDLDDTLIPSSLFYPQAAERTIGADSDWEANFQKARAWVKASLPSGHVAARNRLLYFKAYLELTGDTARSARQLYDLYEAELSHLLRRWVNQSGRYDLIKTLSEKFDLYILTNENTRSQLAKIETLYPPAVPQTLFKGIVTSEEIGFEKPHRQIFEALLQRYGLRAEHCLFVGDSFENDIEPGLALGMSVIQTLEFLNSKPQDSRHQTIEKLEHLKGLLDAYN